MAKQKRDDETFKMDRYGHNHPRHGNPYWSRITYMADANGFVMARRPACTPFVISEKEWLAFSIYDKKQHSQIAR